MTLQRVLLVLYSRPLVFGLASLSFACLLGHLYGLWTMRAFACLVLLPATLVLAYIAFSACHRQGTQGNSHDRSTRGAATWIMEGALGGLVAALAYDLFRLPFVLNGAPLFKVFPQFGRMLLGAPGPQWLVQTLGWTYHFSNGAALGIMFLALVTRPTPRALFWGAVLWAACVEAMLLLTPYPEFFRLERSQTFLLLTASAHLVFGIVLGLWCRRRLYPMPMLNADV